MLLDTYDLEFLKLCGLARYLPCSMLEKYKLPMFGKNISETLLWRGYIKEVKGERKCYRLTRHGKEVLHDLGYDFPDDARTHNRGSIFKRRAISAEIDTLLYGAGINVYAKHIEQLDAHDLTYLPSLTVRADVRNKALAGTRFYGILRIRDIAYVIYYAENESDGIIPDYEEMTFMSLIGHLHSVKQVVIMVMCKSMDSIENVLFKHNRQTLQGGFITFAEVKKKWKYDFCFVPMDEKGLFQLRMMRTPKLRERICEMLCGESLPKMLYKCDGFKDDTAWIFGMDMQITRIKSAVEQTTREDCGANVLCFPHQQGLYNIILSEMRLPNKLMLIKATMEGVKKSFPDVEVKFLPQKPVIKNDRYVEIA